MRLGLFPGQGVPARTVLEALDPESELLDRAAEVLGYDLRKKVEAAGRRPKAVLPTILAQPAIFVAGVIEWERAGEDEPERIDYLAGHSLGEYTALAAAGAMPFHAALRAVAARGEAMQDAAKSSPGGMVAVMRLGRGRVEEIARRAGARIANDNSPEQMVLAGPDGALEEASALVGAAGGRAVLLEVSGAFHTDAMAPAAPVLAAVLDRVEIRSPAIPVISNVTARPYRAPGEIRKLLVAQVTEPVRFRESLEFAHREGVREYRDFGPGRVVERLAVKTFDAMNDAMNRTEEEVNV